MYQGPDFQKIKMTEPTVLDFEMLVLQHYMKIVRLAEAEKRNKGLRDYRDEEREVTHPSDSTTVGSLPWREKFIATYRSCHMHIIQDQVQLLSTVQIILREISMLGQESYQEVIRRHALMRDQNLTHILHVRKYLKALFTCDQF